MKERPRRRWEDIIKRVFNKYALKVWTGFIWLRMGCSGLHKGWGSIDYVIDYQLLKRYCCCVRCQ
jgi:hypothetical protein